jgi:hypothetical protein
MMLPPSPGATVDGYGFPFPLRDRGRSACQRACAASTTALRPDLGTDPAYFRIP